MDIPVDELELKEYEKVQRLAEVARDVLQKKIESVIGGLGDPYLVQAKLEKPRIKSYSSLARKAKQRKWEFVKALTKAQDLVGLRVVCNNLQDVRRVADLLETTLTNDNLKVKCDDYTTTPQRGGYRAIHLVIQMPIRLGNDEAQVGCEIQVRSLLQHSWAELSRAEIYTSEVSVPDSIKRRVEALSNLLARADKIADNIRSDIVRPKRGRRPQAGQPLTASALAFLYRRQFGEEPPDYLIQSILHNIEGHRLRSDGIDAMLADNTFMNKLREANVIASDWAPHPTQIFRWAVMSLIVGKDAALRLPGSEWRNVRRETANVARREALADSPTIDDLVNSIEEARKDEDLEFDIDTWAVGLDVSRGCLYCGTTIIDPDEFAEAAIKYFKVRGKRMISLRERLVDVVRSTAIETGSLDDPSVCDYCDHLLAKD